MREVIFTINSWKCLQELAEEAYPFEGCGLLLGPFNKERSVQTVLPLQNTLRDQGGGRFDFAFSPKEFMEAQLRAEKDNLDIVGIYHTHPDHAARPSATDTNQPMLAGWICVIAAVNGGHFANATAWWREDDTTPFDEMPLVLPVP